MTTLSIAEESPVSADLTLLMARHTAAMHADTPPESIHMMDAASLVHPDIRFFVMRDEDTAVAMGAYKLLGDGHAEIKSMHVLHEHRGRKLAAQLLDHLVAAARAEGLTQLSLETGTQASFQAAQGLYLRAGFEICGPFAQYRIDPNSVFMTKRL